MDTSYVNELEGFPNIATIGFYVGDEGKQRRVFTVFDSGCAVRRLHIWDDESHGREMHICVRMDEPEYFSHGQAVYFSQAEKDAFISFLKAPYTGPATYWDCKFKTVWDFAVMQWNNENPENEIPLEEGENGYVLTAKMPKYELLETYF